MSILDFFRDRTEQRRHARHKVVTTAWLRLKDDTIPFVCVLWDVSEGGARLTVASKFDNLGRIYLDARTRRAERHVLSRRLAVTRTDWNSIRP